MEFGYWLLPRDFSFGKRLKSLKLVKIYCSTAYHSKSRSKSKSRSRSQPQLFSSTVLITDVAAAITLAISVKFDGRIIVFPAFASLPNSFKYCSAIRKFTASFPPIIIYSVSYFSYSFCCSKSNLFNLRGFSLSFIYAFKFFAF